MTDPNATEVLAPGDAPSVSELAAMPRADAVVVWKPFWDQLNAFRAKALEVVVKDSRDTLGMSIARDHRKLAARIRIAAEKVKVERKAFHLREGNAVQSEYNAIAAACKEIEDHSAAQEQFALLETARIEQEARETRHAEILPFLAGPLNFDLGKMTEDQYQKFLQDSKDLFGVRQAREKAEQDAREAAAREREAENERNRLEVSRLTAEREARDRADAEQRERDRVAAEERLAAEAAEAARLKALQAERVAVMRPYVVGAGLMNWAAMDGEEFETALASAKHEHGQRLAEEARREASRLAAEEAQRVEREAAAAERRRIEAELAAQQRAADERERVLKAEADAARVEAERKAEEARREALRLQELADARAAEDARVAAEKETAARADAAAPDIEKIQAFAAAVLAIPFPTLSDAARQVSMEIASKRAAFVAWIGKQTKLLTE